MFNTKTRFIGLLLLSTAACSHEVSLSEHNWQRYNSEPSVTTSTAQLNHLVFFNTDEHTLTDSEKRSLLAFASAAGETATFRLRLEGHTDSRASENYNFRLSELRARSVAETLVKLGFRQTLIEEVAFGESRPDATGNTPADLARNRRVEVVADIVTARLTGCPSHDPTRLRPTSNETNTTLGCSNMHNLMVAVEDKSDFGNPLFTRERNTNIVNGSIIFGANDRLRNRESVELPDVGTIQ